MRNPFRKKAKYNHSCPDCGVELLDGITPKTCPCHKWPGKKESVKPATKKRAKKIRFKADDIIPPIVFLVIGSFGAVGCYSCSKAPLCEHPEGGIKSEIIGSVTMSDGEVCQVEQVTNHWYEDQDSWAHAGRQKDGRFCKMYNEAHTPLARRILCPSGRNGESTVGHDNTKQHNEVIK